MHKLNEGRKKKTEVCRLFVLHQLPPNFMATDKGVASKEPTRVRIYIRGTLPCNVMSSTTMHLPFPRSICSKAVLKPAAGEENVHGQHSRPAACLGGWDPSAMAGQCRVRAITERDSARPCFLALILCFGVAEEQCFCVAFLCIFVLLSLVWLLVNPFAE